MSLMTRNSSRRKPVDFAQTNDLDNEETGLDLPAETELYPVASAEQKIDKNEIGLKSHNSESSRKSFTSFTAYRMPQKQDRISLEFENLVLTVGKQQKVLNGVSGFIEGGAGVAIMGESGCVSAYTLASTYNHKLRLTV